MNFVLDQQPWEELLEQLQPGQTVPVLQLLTVLEQAEEEETESFLDDLGQKQITIDLKGLPKLTGDAGAVRLSLEEKLVRQGSVIEGLEVNDPLRLYLEEIQALPEVEIVENPQTPEEKQRFTDGMLKQTAALAQKYTGMGVLLLDLIQEANLGLWQGVQTFEEGDILSHCRWWSEHYLERAVLLQAKAAGLGQKLRQATEDYRAVDERLLSELGRNPTLEEIAEAMHMSVSETETVADMLESAKLLQRVKAPKQETLPQEEDQAVEDTAYFQMRQRITELLSVLPEADAQLLTLRYGLEGGVPMKPEQVAQKLGITLQELTAREAAALAKLRTEKD